MLIMVNCDVFLGFSGWTIRHVPYNIAILYACNAVSMCAQHKVVLYIDVHHLWLTHQDNCGMHSQTRSAKLTRHFLSCEAAGPLE